MERNQPDDSIVAKLSMQSYVDQYTPVDPDFYDIIASQKALKKEMLIHYFDPNGKVDKAQGEFLKILTIEKEGKYLLFDSSKAVRLDRVITINGRPGPAYDEYDSYALQCLDCMGGMD